MKTLINSINKQLFHAQYKKNTRNWWLTHKSTTMESTIVKEEIKSRVLDPALKA